MIKRERNVAHMWADKQIVRFFRKNFEKREYRKLRDIYLALCEIDSDFAEERESKHKTIHNITKTCTTYAGMDQSGVSEAMQVLRILGLIDYGRKQDQDKGKIIGSYLIMYKWEEEENTLTRENTNKGEPLCIKNILKDRSIKNNSKELGEDPSSSLRKEDKEGNPKISHLASDSANSSTRPSLETANEEVPAKSSRPVKDDSILPRKKVPAGQLEYEHASDEARSLVEDWNGLPTTPVHKNGSQAVRKVLHLLDEKLLKEHGSKGIFKAMLDFSNMQRNAGDYRVPTGKVSIDDFFIGNGYLNGARERRGETAEPAWFQKLILPGSFAKYLRREDPNPEVTEELRYRYRKHVLADQGVSFGPRQESQFREASKRLREFMRRGRLEKFVDNVGYKDYVRFLLDALIGKYKKVTEIEVGHLCSNYTWNDLFPKFIAYNWEE